MRWLFVAIVVLNALYFTWTFLAGKEGGQEARPSENERQFPHVLRTVGEKGGGVVAEGARIFQPLSQCPAIGPLASEVDAIRLAGSLTVGGVSAEARSVEVGDTPVYWVYLPAVGGRQQSLRKLRELHAAGIDSFVVTTGPDLDAISLGSFSVRDSALGLQVRLKSAGHPAQVREQLKSSGRMWWVVLDPGTQGFAELIPQDLRQGVRFQRQPCEG